MTNYCTLRDVRNALTPNGLQETEFPETAASLPDWQIEDAINEAMSVVDAHILPRYNIGEVEVVVPAPTTENPEATETATVGQGSIRWWTRSLAAYYATLTFRKSKDLSEDDPVRLRYQAVMSNLMQIRDGILDLPGFEPTNATSSGEVAVVNTYEGKLFGPEDFGLYPDGYSPQIYVPGRHW